MGVLGLFFKNLAVVEPFEKAVGDPPRRLPKNYYVPFSCLALIAAYEATSQCSHEVIYITLPPA
jgi:hypothetical protein